MANFAVWQYIEDSGIGVLLTGAAVVTIVIGLIVLRLETVAGRPGTAIGRRTECAEHQRGRRCAAGKRTRPSRVRGS